MNGIFKQVVVWVALMATVGGVSLRAKGQQPASQPDWWRRSPAYTSNYYAVKSDINVNDTKALAQHMDFTFESYMSLFSKLPVRIRKPARLNLFLFATQDDYQTTLALRFRVNGAGSWGMHIPRGKDTFLVGWKGDYTVEEMQRLLQHEGFHQIARHYFEDLPTWANEGTAEVFDRGVLVGRSLALGEVSRRDKRRLLAAIESGRIIPFEQFFAVEQSAWNHFLRTRDANLNYLEAWSIVHFFVFAEEGKYEKGFLSFLVLLNRGNDWRQAFVKSFGTPDFKAIELKWLTHVRNLQPADYRETTRRLAFLAAGLKELNKRGFDPANLDELRDALREIKFEHLTNMYGKEKTLSASADEPFTVPLAEKEGARQFKIFNPRTIQGSKRSKSKSPPPGSLYLEGHYPEAFVVTWKRKKREYEYTIESGPNARRIIEKYKKQSKSRKAKKR